MQINLNEDIRISLIDSVIDNESMLAGQNENQYIAKVNNLQDEETYKLNNKEEINL